MNAREIISKFMDDSNADQPEDLVTAILDEIQRRVQKQGKHLVEAFDYDIVIQEIRKELEEADRYPESYWKNNAWTPS